MNPNTPSPSVQASKPSAQTRRLDTSINTSPSTETAQRPFTGEHIGDQIGSYRLLEALGEGGFGTVWLAEQDAPVKRRVAIKILKPGMGSREVIVRFEAERQALAMMDHPHIAHVFDAGSMADGRPYFVMECVQGTNILDFCRNAELSTRSRLELFIQVCQAIQHAHQKGIIHRDVKPSNVLVALHDQRPQAKVIDFGIAKAVLAEGSHNAQFTQAGQMIGTPAYMSPEQAMGSAMDVDTRSDIYSLGVLLYELLTGTTPFSHKELTGRGAAEMLRIVREVDPPRPSERLSGLDDTSVLSADPKARELGSLLRGDLDWITMKCLEKDRTRRYDTANALALDVQRHLQGEAVLAAPPSRGYRFSKFILRHRVAAIGATFVFAALLAGLATTLWQARRAEAQAQRALAAEAEARQRARDLEQVAAFQERQLATIDPERMGERLRTRLLEAQAAGHGATFDAAVASINFTDLALATLDENIFDRAFVAIKEGFADQPLVAARLWQTLANTLGELGRFERAHAAQDLALDTRMRLLGPRHPDTLEALSGRGHLLYSQGELKAAEPYYQQALDGRRAVLGHAHADTLMSINDFGELRFEQGRWAEAEPLFREALAGRRKLLGDRHADTLTSINDLGAALTAQSRLADAEPFYREALEIRRQTLGNDHADTQESLYNMGGLLRAQSRFDDALPLYQEALDTRRRLLGDEHPETLTSLNSMVLLQRDLGHYTEAMPLAEQALTTARKVLGNEHPQTQRAINNLGTLLMRQERFSDAEPYFVEALALRRRTLGDEHPQTLTSLYNLGLLKEKIGLMDEAEQLQREALAGSRKQLGNDHRDTLISITHLGTLLRQMHRLPEADSLGSEAVQIAQRIYSEPGIERANALHEHADTRFAMQDFSGAEALALEAEHDFLASVGAKHEARIANLELLARLYSAWHRTAPELRHDQDASRWKAEYEAAR